VVDKRGVDRADGWNAGLNLATQPLLLTLSPAIVPDRDSLAKAALPFALDPTTIAGFGLVRASAGGGRRAADVPTTVVGGLQHLGASRRALSALVLNPWNAQAGTESGFGLYARDALLNAGGFQPYDAQPGAEMAIRLHGLWRQAGEPYRILQSAWTLGARSAAEGWQELAADEVGRYRSRMELLALHRGTLARSGAGALRTLLLPATLVELVVPLVELVGWLITIGGLATGSVPLDTALLFVASTLGLGLAVSLGSLLVNVACLGIPPALGSTLVLSGLALLDQVGPRQLLHLARLRAWLGPARPTAAA
jgi:hypothetical protein